MLPQSAAVTTTESSVGAKMMNLRRRSKGGFCDRTTANSRLSGKISANPSTENQATFCSDVTNVLSLKARAKLARPTNSFSAVIPDQEVVE